MKNLVWKTNFDV
jgi:hypothetical protein